MPATERLRPGRWMALAAGLLTAVFLALYACRKGPPLEEQPVERIGENMLRLSREALKNIGLDQARVGEFSDRLVLMGRIGVVEERIRVVSARVAGRIEAAYVSSGEQLEEGQIMARFFSPDYAVARDEYLQAKKQASDGDVSDLVDLARKKLLTIGVSPQDIDSLSVSSNTSSMIIRAPHSGALLTKNVVVGNLNSVGDTLFTIGNIDKVWFIGDIYPEDLAKVHKDQEVLITPLEGGISTHGKVSFVSPVVDPTARTIKIRVLMDNKDHGLIPDMYVRGELILRRRACLEISKKALIRLRDSTFCFKRLRGNAFHKIPVEVSGEQDGVVAVSSGLEPGDEVVSEGALLLDAALSSMDISKKP